MFSNNISNVNWFFFWQNKLIRQVSKNYHEKNTGMYFYDQYM